MALAKATAEAIWLRHLLSELGFPQPNPTIIYSDSQSAIALSENPKYHSRSKHVDTQFHFTREKVQSTEIAIHYIPTSDMTADILTKALPRDKHYHCLHRLGMSSYSSDSPVPDPPVRALLTYTQPRRISRQEILQDYYSSLFSGSSFHRCNPPPFSKTRPHLPTFHHLHANPLPDSRQQWHKRHIPGSRRRFPAPHPHITTLLTLLTFVLNSWSGSSTTYHRSRQRSMNSPTCQNNPKPSRRQRKRMRKKTHKGQPNPRQPSNFELYQMQAPHSRNRLRKPSSMRAEHPHTRQIWSSQTHQFQQYNSNQLLNPSCQQPILLQQLRVQEQNGDLQHQCHKQSHIIKREKEVPKQRRSSSSTSMQTRECEEKQFPTLTRMENSNLG